MNNLEKSGALLARMLICVVFFWSGFLKATHWSATAGMLSGKGLPLASLVVAGAVIVELGGGTLLLLGYRARVASFVMFLYLIPATLLFHNFWAFEGMMRQDMTAHFLKNLGIMGGLLMVAAQGAGGWSLDAARARTN